MELTNLTYTLAVSPRHLPFFYRTFKVVKHQNEQVGSSTRLVLTLPDGSVIVIPEITKRHLKVFPDRIVAEANYKRMLQERANPVKEHTDGERRISPAELSDT